MRRDQLAAELKTTLDFCLYILRTFGFTDFKLFLSTRPSWLLIQRYLMGTVLAGLAVRMALEARRP